MIRPNKENTFMAIACLIAQQTTDEQTGCGCVITTKDNRPLGFGYNGHPRGTDWTKLPRTRPEKYPWMIHSEINALSNCLVKPKEVGGGIAYVTGNCCFDCTCSLWNEGVDEIYQLQNFSNPVMVSEKDEKLKKELVNNLFLNGQNLVLEEVRMTGWIIRDDYIDKFKELFL